MSEVPVAAHLSQRRPVGWTHGLVAALGLALVVILGVWALASFLPIRLIDFEHYYAAGRALWHGQNPYGVIEFFAPPWLALLIGPLLWLPARVATGAWLMLTLFALAGSAALSAQWLNFPKAPRARLGAAVAATLAPAAFFVYITGQITALVGLAILYMAWLLAHPDRARAWWSIAPALLVATLKPHVGILLLAACALELVRRRAWGPLALSVGLLGAGAVFGFALAPGWPGALLEAWRGGTYRGGQGLVAPGYIGLAELGLPFWLFLPMAAYVLIRWWRVGLTSGTVALSMAVGLLLVPYNRAYDHVVLIFPAMFSLAATSGRGRVAAALLIAAAALAPLAGLAVAVPALVAVAVLVGLVETVDRRSTAAV